MSDDPVKDQQTTETNGITRREMLIRGGQTAVVAGAAALGAYALYDPEGDAGLARPEPIRLPNYFDGIDMPASAPRISYATGSIAGLDNAGHTLELVRAAIGGLDTPDAAEGIKRFVKRGDVVLIKPNVGFDRGPKLGATTNPDVVRAVVKLCLTEAKARKVIVADNPIEDPAACFVKSGIQMAAEAEGARVMIHSAAHDAPVQVRKGEPDSRKGEALGTWPIFYRPLAEANRVIGIAPIKDHNLCSASMTIKNWYGLLGGRRNQFHQAIHNIISDLGLMMKPTLVIGDGTRVMMYNGPTGGRLDDVRVGGMIDRPVIVASVDQLACDGWCYENLLGRDPENARAPLAYLQMAYEKFGQDADRIVTRSWRDYEKQGLIKETSIGV